MLYVGHVGSKVVYQVVPDNLVILLEPIVQIDCMIVKFNSGELSLSGCDRCIDVVLVEDNLLMNSVCQCIVGT